MVGKQYQVSGTSLDLSSESLTLLEPPSPPSRFPEESAHAGIDKPVIVHIRCVAASGTGSVLSRGRWP